MIRYQLFFLFFICASVGLGQGFTFDYYYKTERSDRIRGAVEGDDGNFYLIVSSEDKNDPISSYSSVVKINERGEYIHSSNLGLEGNNVLFSHIIKAVNNEFIVSGIIQKKGSNGAVVFLSKFDKDLNRIWYKSLKDSTKLHYISQLKYNRVGNELICLGDGIGSTGFISRFSLDGDSLFQKIFTFQSGILAFFDFLELENGEFYIFSYGAHMPGSTPSSEGVTKLVHLDINYNIKNVVQLEYSLTYPHIINNYVQFNNHVTAKWISKDRFLMGGTISNPISPTQFNTDDLGLLCWDKNFNEIYYSIFGDPKLREASQFTNLDFIDTSNIYLVGNNKVSGGSLINEIIDFYVIKTNSLGQVKWEKYFSNNSLLYHHSILATQDGGLLILGHTYKKNYNQDESDGYALKVDSNGFAEIWPVGFEEKAAINHRIYPNPVGSWLSIEAADQGVDYHFELFDNLGRKVFESDFKEVKLLVDTEDLNQGLYLYRLTDSYGNVAKGKVIKR